MKRNNKNKGFTLLEILLVITLIGILIGILLVSVNPNRQLAQARNLSRKSHITDIHTALEAHSIRNSGTILSTVTTTYQDICDTGTRTATDALPNTNYCNGKLDLRVLVPTYINSIPKDNQETVSGNTGYQVAKTPNNQISVRATRAELGESIVINPFTATATTTPSTCPTGYIPVPGNSLYETNNFCVMKYEAKTGSATVAATTQATGFPIVNISQTNSITACSLNGAGYGLINNNEWMTIARNIEGQVSNWTTGTAASTAIGTGGLYRGHSDASPNNPLAANTDDNQGYEGTGNSGFSIERRTHNLSNGEVIWDISGNVWEWTSDTILGQNKPNNSSGNFFQQWTAINNFGSLSYDLTRPSNLNWDTTTGSNKNTGQYLAGTFTFNTNFAFVRSGGWDNTTASGVFTLTLDNASSNLNGWIGFRCVLR